MSAPAKCLQDWTKQESEDAEGVVTFSYRTERDNPPDIQTIQKQMAIVAWQPGPNRVVQVPTWVRTTGRWPLSVMKIAFSVAVAIVPECKSKLPFWRADSSGLGGP